MFFSTLASLFICLIGFLVQNSVNITTCPCIHGICVEDNNDDANNNAAEESICFCYNGYTGRDCSINFDECLPGRNPCQNRK